MRTFSLYLCKSLYSSVTASADVHPRSHCNAFSASVVRPFAISQIGVSGTHKMAAVTNNGTAAQHIATCRHGITKFNQKTNERPPEAKKPMEAVKGPRVDGSLKKNKTITT